MNKNFEPDTGIADRVDYDRIVVETEFENGYRFTISKEPNDDQFQVYIENIELADPASVQHHNKAMRLPIEIVIKALHAGVEILRDCERR